MTTAMAQIERGTNRIYGIRRDRPALGKYGRAAVLTAVLAVPVGAGFLLLVAGGAFADAMAEDYGWSDGFVDALEHRPVAGRGSRCWCSPSRWCSTTPRGAGSPGCPGWRWGPGSRWC